MDWVSGGLAAACLGTGLLHVLRVALRRRDVAAELSHAAMGLGMAAMLSPLGNPVPGPVWTVVFVLGVVWFGGAVLRSRTFGGDAGHHVVGSGAMLLMLAAGHSAHGRGVAGTLGLASVLALALTGYFAWHALRCADGCRRAEPAPGVVATRTRTLVAPQLAAGAQLVTAATMSVMLLGMV
ncbi:uncharacterized protein DUF5134 [Pseudonocardia hierapolitana]|uniref:Uncharacterized protein DUF5134 n=2 Tax=Pseudonocardia hierapolitana TaxID=1128676 RepID=A0A561SUY4_9PSEU|nr:uncharacterized protein DUF5134 [Pseudonocardia hierapolitana]